MSLPLLGAGRGVDGGGGGPWDPLSLSNSPSLWMENDPTKLYTDAGTTLVSGDAQAVYQANDKSGLNHHFSQPTLGNRPLYKVGPKPYLLFDHTDDYMSTASAAFSDGSGQISFAIACRVDSVADTETMISGGYGRLRSATGILSSRSYDNIFGATDDDADASAQIVAGTPFVAMYTVSTTALETYFNLTSNGSTALTGSRQNAASGINIGCLDGPTSFLGGPIYGIVVMPGVFTPTDRSNLQTYMAGLYT